MIHIHRRDIRTVYPTGGSSQAMHDNRKRSNHKSYLTHVNINTQTYHIHTCAHKPTTQVHKHMNISTLSYAQIQWEFSCGKICRTLLLSATWNDRCVVISPWQWETWTVHLRTCSYYTAVQERVYTYTCTHSHPHTHNDSLEHFSICRYNPHAVSQQWSQYSGLLWGTEAGLKSCTSLLPTYYHFHKHGLSFEGILVLWWWTQVNLRSWVLNWVRIRNTLTLFRFVYL